jgi:hypothetical protein
LDRAAEFGGFRVPAHVEVAYVLDRVDFAYAGFDVTSFEYNVAGLRGTLKTLLCHLAISGPNSHSEGWRLLAHVNCFQDRPLGRNPWYALASGVFREIVIMASGLGPTYGSFASIFCSDR